jgi:RHH-type transcriptional regulator, rel operon repressor / antitoxin RelB
MLAVELPNEIEARLERLARKTGRPQADHVREAILEYLEDLEDEELARQRIKKPSEKRWTLEELESGLDLEN